MKFFTPSQERHSIIEFDPSVIPAEYDAISLSSSVNLQRITNPFPDTIKIINLLNCPSLEILPQFSRVLTDIDLRLCKKLTTIPILPRELNELLLDGCEKLTTLPPLPPGLKVLSLGHCSELTKLPPLPEDLNDLNLEYCEKLTTLPPFPPRIKTLSLRGCSELTDLPEFPEDIIDLDLNRCGKLKTLPPFFPPRLKTLSLEDCVELTELPKFPPLLTEANLEYCKKLKTLPPFPENLTWLNLFQCESLEKLPNKFPPKLTILKASYCEKLKTLPPFPPELQELTLRGCVELTDLPPFPERLTKLNLRDCKKLTKLPEFPKYLTEINLEGCNELTTLHESLLSLDNLQTLNLLECEKLSFENINLLERLEKKHSDAGNTQFKIFWPGHFVPLNFDSLNKAYEELIENNESQPIYTDRSTLKLFQRFTTENLDQRGNYEVIFDEADQVAKVIKYQPYLLDVLEDNSSHYLKECVNQPVMGFVKAAILTDFADEQDISKKLNIAKRMAIIATIEQEILGLKNQFGNMIGGGIQIELGNAMLREVYNQNKALIEDQTAGAWKGIPKGITYEGAIMEFLTQENIEKVCKKVDDTLKSLSDTDKARDYVVGASLNGTRKDFAIIILGKEGFDERRQELKTLRVQYQEIEDSSSPSAIEISEKIKAVEQGTNLKERVEEKIRVSLYDSGEDRIKRQKIDTSSPGASPTPGDQSVRAQGASRF